MRIPEKAIAETSGHKSAKALQGYESTSSAQKQAGYKRALTEQRNSIVEHYLKWKIEHSCQHFEVKWLSALNGVHT